MEREDSAALLRVVEDVASRPEGARYNRKTDSAASHLTIIKPAPPRPAPSQVGAGSYFPPQ